MTRASLSQGVDAAIDAALTYPLGGRHDIVSIVEQMPGVEDAKVIELAPSLGAAEYQRELGLTVLDQYDDQGMNHYFDVIKEGQ